MKIKYKDYPNETKCKHCNWKVTRLYSFENRGGEGCANCFMDMLIEGKYEIKR